MKLSKLAGATSEIWQVFIKDSSSTTGRRPDRAVFNSASLTAYYHRDTDTTATAITLVTMTVGTFTSAGSRRSTRPTCRAGISSARPTRRLPRCEVLRVPPQGRDQHGAAAD
jgi:hypothetical protein